MPASAIALRRAAGGDQLDAGLGERAGEIDQPGLVGNRKQGAANGNEVGRGNVLRGDGHAAGAFQSG